MKSPRHFNMETNWQELAKRWLDSWLKGLVPGISLSTPDFSQWPMAQFANIFGGAATGEPESVPQNPAIHFKYFAELIRTFAEAQQDVREQPLALGPLVRALVLELQRQVSVIRTTSIASSLPLGDWTTRQSAPILGPARESHRQWAAITTQMATAARAAHLLRIAHLDALSLALERLGTGLDAEDGRELRSLRALYDWWVECADGAYREIAFGEDYAREFAHMVNATCAAARVWRDGLCTFADFFVPPSTPRPTRPTPVASKRPHVEPPPVPAKNPRQRRATLSEFDIGRIARSEQS
ncbi:MAG: poly(R)-hydroxyalkanoic acid synthase subunit PhaE [Gammaproteobacteria bacterium]